MKKLRIERKPKNGTNTSTASTETPPAPALESDCFTVENVPLLQMGKDLADADLDAPLGDNVIGFIGKAGVGKTTLSEIVAGTRRMSPPAASDANVGDNDRFGVRVHKANGMVILDTSAVLSGILPPLKASSGSVSLSSFYDLELVAFMFSVCTKVVIVQSQLHDSSILECISSSFLLREGKHDHLPEVVIALNRQNMELPVTTSDEERVASEVQTVLAPHYGSQTPKLFVMPDTGAELASAKTFKTEVEALYMELIREPSSSSRLPPAVCTQKDWIKYADKAQTMIHSRAVNIADCFQKKIT